MSITSHQNKRGGVPTDTRHAIEETFHDKKAGEALGDFYLFNPLEIADAFSIAQLGELRGKRLLEIGCGDGRLATQFAQAQADVTSIDISGEMVQLTKRAAERAGVADRVAAIRMSCEDLSFPDECFDVIYGHSILHHLNLATAANHLARVLREGGVAVFVEPLGSNPVLKAFRYLTPQRRTPTEEPLTIRRLETMGRRFRVCEHREFYLASLGAFVWYYGYKKEVQFKRSMAMLHGVDQWLFGRIPMLRRYAWVSVLTCRR